MFQKKIAAFVLISVFAFAKAQVHETPAPPYIKTIQFKGDNTAFGQLPIVNLGAALTVSFDDIYGDEADYYYKITHHNADWTLSNLAQAEYMKGMDNVRIVDYENSVATLQLYTHYTLRIPNNNTQALTKSGNYMLSIYDENDDIVFSRKFMIYTTQVGIGIEIKRSRDLNYIDKKQVVRFFIDSGETPLINPKNTVKTVLFQNNDLKNKITGLTPQFTLGNRLEYRYDKQASFWAGNEFFSFENRDIRNATNAVRRVAVKDLYHNYLFIDPARRYQEYSYNPDINGRFTITALEGVQPAIENDYAWIHFTLDAIRLPQGQEAHVYGNFNNFELSEQTRLKWNIKTQKYELPLLLKQGYYDYKYIVTDQKKQPLPNNEIDGDFWQTENDYHILVYYRAPGGRYDELIGIGHGNSGRITN